MIFLYLRELELKTDQSPLFFFLYLFLKLFEVGSHGISRKGLYNRMI